MLDQLICMETDRDWMVADEPQDDEALDINAWLEFTQAMDKGLEPTPEEERWAASQFAASQFGEFPVEEDVPVRLYRDKQGEWACNAFWVCLCDDNFVHEHTQADCPHCGSTRFESPDADIDSVRLFADQLNPDLVAEFNSMVGLIRHGGEL